MASLRFTIFRLLVITSVIAVLLSIARVAYVHYLVPRTPLYLRVLEPGTLLD